MTRNSRAWSNSLDAEFTTRRGWLRPGLIVVITLLASMALLRTGLPGTLRAPLAVLLVLFSMRAWRMIRTHRIALPRNAPARLDDVSGALSVDYIMPFYAAFRVVAPDGRSARAALFRDQLAGTEFRRLLARLRDAR